MAGRAHHLAVVCASRPGLASLDVISASTSTLPPAQERVRRDARRCEDEARRLRVDEPQHRGLVPAQGSLFLAANGKRASPKLPNGCLFPLSACQDLTTLTKTGMASADVPRALGPSFIGRSLTPCSSKTSWEVKDRHLTNFSVSAFMHFGAAAVRLEGVRVFLAAVLLCFGKNAIEATGPNCNRCDTLGRQGLHETRLATFWSSIRRRGALAAHATE